MNTFYLWFGAVGLDVCIDNRIIACVPNLYIFFFSFADIDFVRSVWCSLVYVTSFPFLKWITLRYFLFFISFKKEKFESIYIEMAWRFKASKYKNAAPIVPKPEVCVRDVW